MSDVLPPQPPEASLGPKIYLLPNLMTAGNLCCGFAATLKIVDGLLIVKAAADEGILAIARAQHEFVQHVHFAIWLILAACIFDMLDGRLARLGGTDSDFGREFDSLADVVSFGVAPALMVYSVVFTDFYPQVALVIASTYLVCGALRLARFNCVAAMSGSSGGKAFTGFPIPAAAGLIASLTRFLFWLRDKFPSLNEGAGKWSLEWMLALLLLVLAWLMFSTFQYPSFKGIGWRTTRSLPKFVVILAVAYMTAINLDWMPFVLFLTYLIYGFLRPFLSRRMKEEIEEEPEEEGLPDAPLR